MDDKHNLLNQRFGRWTVIGATEKDSARRNYISALRTYWSLYYGLRSMTGYDYEKNQKIAENYPEI